VCEGIPDWAYYSDFRDELLRIGNHYSQEAVAVTTGTTVFV
jgi:hypothetical protein